VSTGQCVNASTPLVWYRKAVFPPGARTRVALTGLTIEEYYISVTWRAKVSCCSLTTSSVSHKRVPSEVSALLGRILSAISNQLTLSMDMDDR
jgi:F0F1-type ATP synthase beta subunit